jgi:hypothetical protein
MTENLLVSSFLSITHRHLADGGFMIASAMKTMTKKSSRRAIRGFASIVAELRDLRQELSELKGTLNSAKNAESHEVGVASKGGNHRTTDFWRHSGSVCG